MPTLNSSSHHNTTDESHNKRGALGCGKRNKRPVDELTPELILPSTPARKTSEYFDSLNNLDPMKHNPPDLGTVPRNNFMSDTRNSYSSFADSNPFADERNTQMGDFYEARKDKPATGAQRKGLEKLRHKQSGISHSQSESRISYNWKDSQPHNLRFKDAFLSRGGHDMRLTNDTNVSSANSRGRSLLRTPSPTKYMDEIKEDQQPMMTPPSPAKRSRSPMKQMFGERGWLGKSTSMKELPSEEYRKTGIKHWGGKIKNQLETFTEDVSRKIQTAQHHYESPSKSGSPPKTKFHVSLSPPLQAKLYSEIELMICATANQYVTAQQEEGRMSVESLAKVVQTWGSKGRPQVIEFMFDQATQRDLILYNLETFRFYGAHAEDLLAMNTMMQSWKTLAREMAVRTFCTPDSVIRKHMHDVYQILEMLGAPLVTFLAFQEIQVKALKIMREEQKKRDEHEAIKFGVERKWEPPAGVVGDVFLDNPFA